MRILIKPISDCRSVVMTLGVFLNFIIPISSAFVLEGSKTSYAQFPKWDGASDSSLSFEFRTDQPSGLLLYSDHSSCVYLEIKLGMYLYRNHIEIKIESLCTLNVHNKEAGLEIEDLNFAVDS